MSPELETVLDAISGLSNLTLLIRYWMNVAIIVFCPRSMISKL